LTNNLLLLPVHTHLCAPCARPLRAAVSSRLSPPFPPPRRVALSAFVSAAAAAAAATDARPSSPSRLTKTKQQADPPSHPLRARNNEAAGGQQTDSKRPKRGSRTLAQTRNVAAAGKKRAPSEWREERLGNTPVYLSWTRERERIATERQQLPAKDAIRLSLSLRKWAAPDCRQRRERPRPTDRPTAATNTDRAVLAVTPWAASTSAVSSNHRPQVHATSWAVSLLDLLSVVLPGPIA